LETERDDCSRDGGENDVRASAVAHDSPDAHDGCCVDERGKPSHRGDDHGAVDDDFDVVEPMSKDRDPDRYRESGERQQVAERIDRAGEAK
jgi:hypothetical protein